MSNFKRNFSEKISRFMYGRNGMDILSRDIYYSSLILLVVEIFSRSNIIYILSFIGFAYSMFRIMSRNVSSRQKENQKYYCWKTRRLNILNQKKRRFQDRKTHRYFKCPDCGQAVRVPKGKGRISITCPKCSNKFIKKRERYYI